MLISGAPVTTVRDGIEKVDVVARAVPSERLDLGHVGDLTVTSRNGVAVPLTQIAKIEYAHEEPILWRRNRDMAITVRGRRRRRRAGARRDQPDLAQAAANPRQPGTGLPDRGGRRVRGVRQGQCLDLRAVSADGHRDADAADDPVAELLAPAAGVPHGAAGHRRCIARTERRQPAVRLRGAARIDRAGRHDHAQCGDPGRPDRDRCRPRA